MTKTTKHIGMIEEYGLLLDQARDLAFNYIGQINNRPIFPNKETLKNLSLFDEPLPEKPTDPAEMLAMLHKVGSPATIAQLGGRYFGFVNGGVHPGAMAAKWLSDVWDQNGALFATSPINSKIEEVCEKWLNDLLGLPKDTAASFVSGTSTALALAFVTARNELLLKAGWDVNKKGLFGAPEIKVVVGEQAHGMVYKALAFVGLGMERLTKCPSDDQGRMIPDKLPKLDNMTLLVAQAGNVNSGAFDPLLEICTLAKKADAWVHIDGAFGMWAAASTSKRGLLKGYEMVDSFAIDAHKTLNAPYDSGILLCKNRKALVAAMQASGSYIQLSEQRDPMFYTLEMSRRARAIELWAILKTLGKCGVEDLVDNLCSHAKYFAKRLKEEGFEIKNDVVFNQILVVGHSNNETEAILSSVQKSGELWCGKAEWKGSTVIRLSVSSWATTIDDIDRSVEAFVKARQGATG